MVVIFLGYLGAIGFVPDVRRVFGYHGAEHKTINAYEKGDALDRRQSGPQQCRACALRYRLSVVVAVISILVFGLLGRPSTMVVRIASRLVLIPVIAGIAYEYIKFSASHQKYWLMRALIAPGLWLQRLTTRPPDGPMSEVAITAFQRLLVEEQLVAVEEPQPASQPAVATGPIPAGQTQVS